MAIFIRSIIQKQINKLGYQIRRINEGVSLDDAYLQQKQLLKDVNVKVIFDVGASDGRTSVHYHELFPEATIYTFEPNPSSYKKLLTNCADKPYIIPLNYAVSDKIGEETFSITALEDASSLLEPNTTGSEFDRYHTKKTEIYVKTITIDEICKKYSIDKIDILKLDTQGAELMALKGAGEGIKRKGIQLIYSECQFIKLYKNAALFFEINNFLDQNDYGLFNLYNFSYNQKGQLAWGDCIFLPN
jgi:FkbM family methyltransferase